MAKKLYVGNLPYKTTQEDLKELFSKFGAVTSSILISDKFTGRSKGFGFVEMDDEAADKATKEMNGYEMEGRKLVVNEARPMVPRENRPFQRRDNRDRN
jgi:RNA recognition motif-containing protein